MNILDIALWGAIVPALVVFLAILLARSPRTSNQSLAAPSDTEIAQRSHLDQLRPLLIPLAVAAALTIAFVSIMGPLRPWPIESVRRMPHALAAAFVLATIASRVHRAGFAACSIAALLAPGLAAWSILEVLASNARMDSPSLWASVAILALLAAPGAPLLLRAARGEHLSSLTFALSMVAPFLALSIALMLSARTESGARLSGAGVAACSAIAASAFLPRRFARAISLTAPIMMIVLTTALIALLVWGRWFAGTFSANAWHPGLPWTSLALFALAPTLAGALTPATRAPTRRSVVAVLASAILSIGGLIVALADRPTSPRAEDPYADLTESP